MTLLGLAMVLMAAGRAARCCGGGNQGADRGRLQAGAAGAGAGVRKADRSQGDPRQRHGRCADEADRRRRSVRSRRAHAGRGQRPFRQGQVRRRQPDRISRVSASASWSRTGTPKPDISSVDAFKKALLAAKSVAYIDPAAGGSSGIYVSGLLDKLGIAAEVKPKAKLIHGRRGRRAHRSAARPRSAFIRSARSCR